MLLERVFHVIFSFFPRLRAELYDALASRAEAQQAHQMIRNGNLLFGLLWNVFCWHYLSLSAT